MFVPESTPPVRLDAVNVGTLERLHPEHRTRTGIHKRPVGGAVLCDANGLLGDAVGNRKHHGGPDQAVYLYSVSDYAWWEQQLGHACPPGLFGENLTIADWWPSPRVGDRIRFGDVVLELTAPRIPCATLAARLGDPSFVKRFAAAGRSGAYARVLQGGTLEAGQEGRLSRGDADWPTIDALFALWYARPRDASPIIHALRAPLAHRYRDALLGWLPAS